MEKTGPEKEKKKYTAQNCAPIVAEESGMSVEEAEARLREAKQHGVMYKNYVRCQFWRYPLEKVLEIDPNSGRRRRIAEAVAEERGKDPVEIERQIVDAKINRGLRIGYFRKYKWDTLTEEEKDGMFLKPYSRYLSEKYRTEDSHSDMLNHKPWFYREFADVIGRKYFYTGEDMTYEQFRDGIGGFTTDYFIFKPEVSSGGKGINKYSVKDDVNEEVFEEIRGYGDGTIEEFLVQHHEMNRLCPDSVNTIRIVCIFWDGVFRIIYAVCRMSGGDGTPVDNISRGGMAAGVDLETGKINTYGADSNGDPQERHPGTGTELMGFQIPFWPEVKELVERCSRKAYDVAGLGYVGWDVAITENGPIIIEGNNWPSPSLIQLCNFITYHKGMKYLIEDYL